MARRLYILTAPRGARSLVQSAVILTTQNADWTLGVTPVYWHDARATGDLGGDTISHRQLPKGQAKQPHNDSRTRARISTTLTWGLGLPEALALVWVLWVVGGQPGSKVFVPSGVSVAFLALIARRFSTSTWRRGRKRGTNGS